MSIILNSWTEDNEPKDGRMVVVTTLYGELIEGIYKRYGRLVVIEEPISGNPIWFLDCIWVIGNTRWRYI